MHSKRVSSFSGIEQLNPPGSQYTQNTEDLASIAALMTTCTPQPWQGFVWRCHSPKYLADDASGSLRVTGRYHRGRDRYPDNECWPALYTGLNQAIVLGERTRHSLALDELANIRISELRVSLESVINVCVNDRSDPLLTIFGSLVEVGLCHSIDYRIPHAVAQEARRYAEALLIPSCTRIPGGNLIVFSDRLRPGSSIEVVGSITPELRPDLASQ